jgi:peptidyl-prolyl cis-trans isomerase D
MLQAIRSKAGSYIVKGLFVLLILSFGAWGIITRSPFQEHAAADAVIATVGDQTIRVQDFQALLQPTLQRLRAQLGVPIDKQQIKQFGIVDTLLGQLVDRSLLDQEAERLKLDVADQVVRSAITSNPAFRGPDGRFDRNRFHQALAANNLSEEQFIERLRHDIPRTDILHAVTVGVVPPHSVVEALYRYRNEKRIAEIVSIPMSAAGDIGQPDDADLNKFYEDHPELFRAPEYRGFTLVSLTPADIESTIEIPEATLQKEYDERRDEYVTPERREVQQILSPSEEKAKEVEAALAAGKEWNEIATTVAGQAPDTIDLGLLKREEMPQVLADVAFALQLNQASQPIKTPLGWHILRVVKIEPAATQSFAEAEPALRAELAREEAARRLDKLGNKVDDALAGGATLAEVAPKFGLKMTQVAAADEAGRDEAGHPISIPVDTREVMKIVFQTEKGDTSRVIAGKDGTIFAVHVDTLTPPHVRPLADVREKAISAWQAERRREVVVDKAKEMAAAIKPDVPLAKLAADRNLTVTTSPPLSRRDENGSITSPALVTKLFSAKPGEVVTTEDAKGAYVAVLKEVQVPDTPTDLQLAPIRDDLTSRIKLDLATEFTEALRSRYPVKLEPDVIERAY